MNRRSSAVLQLRPIGNPPLAGEHRDTEHSGKNDLCKAGMNNGQPVMKQPYEPLGRLEWPAQRRQVLQPTQAIAATAVFPSPKATRPARV